MPLISSLNNSQVKLIRSLQHRKDREATGLFFVEGIRPCAEAVQLHAPVELLVVGPRMLTSDFALELVARAAEGGTAVVEVTDEVFASISSKDGPQGLAAVIRQRWDRLEDLELEDDDAFVALDAVQDPGNLGTILRTADAVRFGGMILLGNSTDPYHPRAVRASTGAIFSLRLAAASYEEFATWKQRRGYHVIGTSGEGGQHYQTAAYWRPLVVLSGSEREGLAPQLVPACDELVRIPMVGRCDSLNLAVATSVVLYEAFNQRHPPRELRRPAPPG